MSLQDWVDNGWLQRTAFTPLDITKFLEAVDRDVETAGVPQIHPDWKFNIAYNAVLGVASAALAAEGFRAARDQHHYKVLDSLRLTLGIDSSQCGKTHFLRAAGDLAREKGLLTSYVALSSVEDYEDVTSLAREILCNLRGPEIGAGRDNLLRGIVTRLRARLESEGISDPDFAIEAWRQQLGDLGFPHLKFSQVLRLALDWMDGESEHFELALRWLLGELPTPEEAKILGVQTIRSKVDRRRHGKDLLFSWLQLVRVVGFPGTCILLDEAERALNVRGKAQQRALGVMRTLGDSILSGESKATLILMAVTPEVIEALEKYPALAQRYAAVGGTFSAISPYCPRIDLGDLPIAERDFLHEIADRLIDLAVSVYGEQASAAALRESLRLLVEEALRRGSGDVSLRRIFVRAASAYLEMAVRSGRQDPLNGEEAAKHYDGSLQEILLAESREPERD